LAAVRVKWFDEAKGFGFIAPTYGSADALENYSVICGSGLRTLAQDQSVKRDVRHGPKRPQAVRVMAQE
jgi:CspA family cold shock protein